MSDSPSWWEIPTTTATHTCYWKIKEQGPMLELEHLITRPSSRKTYYLKISHQGQHISRNIRPTCSKNKMLMILLGDGEIAGYSSDQHWALVISHSTRSFHIKDLVKTDWLSCKTSGTPNRLSSCCEKKQWVDIVGWYMQIYNISSLKSSHFLEHLICFQISQCHAGTNFW